MSSLDSQDTDRPRAETQEDTDVVVVGGGLAGLTAARNVSRGGHEVAVVEARDRVGGRLLSEQLPSGQTVDLGGQWVAPSQSRVRALLDEYDIDTQSQYDAGVTHLRIRGEDSTFEGTVPSLSRLALVNVEVATRLLERMSQKVPLDAPYEAPKAETWDATTVETWKRRYVKHPAARELFDVAIRAVLTSEPADVSLLFLLFYVRSGGGSGTSSRWRTPRRMHASPAAHSNSPNGLPTISTGPSTATLQRRAYGSERPTYWSRRPPVPSAAITPSSRCRHRSSGGSRSTRRSRRPGRTHATVADGLGRESDPRVP